MREVKGRKQWNGSGGEKKGTLYSISDYFSSTLFFEITTTRYLNYRLSIKHNIAKIGQRLESIRHNTAFWEDILEKVRAIQKKKNGGYILGLWQYMTHMTLGRYAQEYKRQTASMLRVNSEVTNDKTVADGGA